MNEQESNLKSTDTEDIINLGCNPNDEFDPFEGTDFDDDEESREAQTKFYKNITQKNPQLTTQSNPLETALHVVEKTDEKAALKSLFAMAPVFDYAGVTEDVENSSLTFEELRIQKSEDFPELEDGKRVSWTVEYGKITKTVSNPKGTTIAKMKSDIETSKEFLEQLKKSKDKQPTCKLKPKVTAQSKGINSVAYKGVFATLEDAVSSDKVITFFPSKDGKVYEMRKNEMGGFITPSVGCDLLSDVQAGFIPALPLIPFDKLLIIVGFFRKIASDGSNEALVNIYWDKRNEKFIIDVPKQTVSPVSVESVLSFKYDNDRYVHYMDIHSHNQMNAFFSQTDNKDEKATRLYAVIGKVNQLYPEIKVRISNGGQHLEIDPCIVFEKLNDHFEYAQKWFNQIIVKRKNDSSKDNNLDIGMGVFKNQFHNWDEGDNK